MLLAQIPDRLNAKRRPYKAVLIRLRNFSSEPRARNKLMLSGCRRYRYDIRLIAAQSRQVDRNWREHQIAGGSAPKRRANHGVDADKYWDSRRENASSAVDRPEPRCRRGIDGIYT